MLCEVDGVGEGLLLSTEPLSKRGRELFLKYWGRPTSLLEACKIMGMSKIIRGIQNKFCFSINLS